MQWISETTVYVMLAVLLYILEWPDFRGFVVDPFTVYKSFCNLLNRVFVFSVWFSFLFFLKWQHGWSGYVVADMESSYCLVEVLNMYKFVLLTDDACLRMLPVPILQNVVIFKCSLEVKQSLGTRAPFLDK